MLLLDLENGPLKCRVAPEMGGSIYSFDYKAGQKIQPLMRPAWGEDAHLITDFASWPLVPFSNRILHGKFRFGGKDYRVPVTWLGYPHASHGHGWERPWRVERHDETRCDLSFAFDDEIAWPFPYKAEQNFSLSENALDLRLSLVNSGDKPMPAGLGHHPYFPKPPGTTLQAKIGGLWEVDKDVIPTRRIPVPPRYDFSSPKALDDAELDHCFDGYEGLMEIVWPGRPVTLRVSSSENLRHWVVYTPAGKDFFCAEPVSHMPDAVNRMDAMETGLQILQPGQSLTADYRFEIAVIKPE
ncbi:MAG: aldose 1-epimerase [Alphaproteobacteria bacterium]